MKLNQKFFPQSTLKALALEMFVLILQQRDGNGKGQVQRLYGSRLAACRRNFFWKKPMNQLTNYDMEGGVVQGK